MTPSRGRTPLAQTPAWAKRRATATHTEACSTKSPPASRRPQGVRPIQRFLHYEVHSTIYLVLIRGLPNPLLASDLVFELRLFLGQLAKLRLGLRSRCPGVQNDLLDAIYPLTQLRAPARGTSHRTARGPLRPTSCDLSHGFLNVLKYSGGSPSTHELNHPTFGTGSARVVPP